MLRRLPIYLMLDCSTKPILMLSQLVKTFIAELKSDPDAIETAYLSVITFGRSAQQVSPLTHILEFQPPNLVASEGVVLGAGLRLLAKCLDREVQKPTATSKNGDWKSLVFLFMSEQPTDSWQQAAAELKQKKLSSIIACTLGDRADEFMLKQITEIVVKLKTLQPDDLKGFFKWISQSINNQISQSVDIPKCRLG